MKRWITLLPALLLAATALWAEQDPPRSAKAILTEVRKTLTALAKDGEAIDDPKKMEERVKEHAKTVCDLVSECEKNHPKSPVLADVRSEGLKVMDLTSDPDIAKKTLATAQALKATAAKGSDHAAQADLVLMHAAVTELLKDVESPEELKSVWSKNADVLHQKIEEYVTAYPKYPPALEHLSELAGLAATAEAPRTRRLIMESVARHFPDHSLAREMRREDAVGKAFDLDLQAVKEGKAVEGKDLQGKVVVIDFWATWCGPCKKDMPELKKLYEKHAKDGLEIVGVSLDEEAKLAEEYVKENTLPWAQLIGKKASEFAEKWGIEEIPVVFAIDRKGKLRSVDARGKLDKLVAELLAEK